MLGPESDLDRTIIEINYDIKLSVPERDVTDLILLLRRCQVVRAKAKRRDADILLRIPDTEDSKA